MKNLVLSVNFFTLVLSLLWRFCCGSLCSFLLLYWILSKFKRFVKLTEYNPLESTESSHLAALQQGYAVLIHFSGEQYLTLFVTRTWIQDGESGQESVSARGVYENSDLTIIIKFHLFIRCIYSFYTTKTSDACLVATLQDPVVSRRTTDLGWVGVTDISCRYTYNLPLLPCIHVCALNLLRTISHGLGYHQKAVISWD